jgi:aspartate aminotransferase
LRISQRVQNIAPSATMAMSMRAKHMVKVENKDVISFALGEPDFPTPESISQAAVRALDAGHTKYTDPSGTERLKQAIAVATERDLGVAVSPAEICVSNGAKHVLANIFSTLLDPGDHVILVAPYWVSYADQIGLCDGTWSAVTAPADADFVPHIADVEAAITDRTVAILINSPNNPSGAVWDRPTIEALGELALRRNLSIISDEIYKHIIFDGREHVSPAMLGDEVRKHTIIVDGVSKTYSMTGWRIGWLIAPEEFAKAAGKLQSQMTSCPNSIAQEAAADALLGPQDAVADMRTQFEARRDLVFERISAIEDLQCREPAGAFYVFPDVTGLYGRELGGKEITSDSEVGDYLLDHALVSTVPGVAFGMEGYIRLSFACSTEEIEEGVARIAEALA